MPKVTVLVPVFNAEEYLEQCMTSLLSQSLTDIEIICIDDGSTDGSTEILSRFAQGDERLMLLEQQNAGVSAARNCALSHATGDFLLFVDADDYFELDMIEAAYERGVADTADVVVFGARYDYGPTRLAVDATWMLQLGIVPEERPFDSAAADGALYRFTTPAVWNKLLRRQFVEAHGLRFHEELRRAEDIPFTYVVLALAQRITIVDRVLYHYRKGLPTGLQSSFDDDPTCVCRSLLATQEDLRRHDVFERVERDFVNAALDQCLYTLRTLRSGHAHEELVSAIGSTYAQALGLLGRERGYYYDPRQEELLEQLQNLDAVDFLFRRASTAWSEAAAASERASVLAQRLARAEERESRLGQQLAQAQERETQLVQQLELAQERETMLAEQLVRSEAEGDRRARRIENLLSSRSYRVGRALTAVPRLIKKRLFRATDAE